MKLLVIKLSSLGDLFHALPAVHQLKTGLSAEVHWVVNAEYVSLVRQFTDVDRVVPFPRHDGLRAIAGFVKQLRQTPYDLVVDLQGLLKSAWIARVARAARRIGPSFHREGSRLLYDAVAGPRNKQRHAVEENLDVVRYLGLPAGEPVFPVACPVPDLPPDRPRVAMVCSSRWATKNWPPEGFAEVARRLQATCDASIFLVGGSDSRAVHERIRTRLSGKVTDLAGRCTLVETLGVLNAMDLVVANDTGPIHMAAAVGTPVLALFGPTDPVRTGPFGPMHRVVQAGLPCQPCFSRTCRRGGVPCMEGITPERVVEAAIAMLEKAPSRGSLQGGFNAGG